MNYVYSALLLQSAGQAVTEENVKKVVSAVEQPDDAKVKALVAALEGVDIADVISKAAMPTAVAAPVAAVPVAEKKEGPSEEEIEKKAEEAAGGLSMLFA